MTLPLNLEASTYDAVVLPFGPLAGRLSTRAAVIHGDLHDHFANRVGELHKSLQTLHAEFEALLEERLAETEEFCRLGEAAHELAEEADALLALLVRCSASQALVQQAEEVFDSSRHLEEEIAEALEWDKGMGRRLMALGFNASR